ncbi:hypothetical protein SLL00_03420 [Metabacillus indicus]|uniref:hypothetical protein n=1 Tax=Metabacillus indicus TaxID=246786 RepID=UPI002A07AF2B|nr:hypothetical protein [Metabacillus indicus]MDX8288823.1 hypothetical protein [Metabacillus indicus]
MSQLRETLLEMQKEKTLKLLLGASYDTATQAQKDHFLSIVGNQINVDVDRMLHDYVLSYNSNTPLAKKNNKLRWVYISCNVILASASGYAINIENWPFVIFLGLLTILNQFLPFIYNKE